MLGKRLAKCGCVLFMVVGMTISGCTRYGKKPPKPVIIIVPESRSVRIIEPNETFQATRRSAVLEVGWYIELMNRYMEVEAGFWQRVR